MWHVAETMRALDILQHHLPQNRQHNNDGMESCLMVIFNVSHPLLSPSFLQMADEELIWQCLALYSV
jgi:hypothetical protein